MNASDGNWYDCDDSRISLIDQNTVMTPAAYLLFYQRRTSKTTDFQNILEMVRQREAALKEQADLDAEAQGSQTTIDIGTPPVADAETIFANQSAIA